MRLKMEDIKNWLKENRKNSIYVGIALLTFLCVISLFLMRIAFKKNEKVFLSYSDNKNLEYKVLLKENEYYKDNQMAKGNQYIANLIQHISADFNYHFNLPAHYQYHYKIIGVVDVVDEKTNKTIYSFSEDLLTEQIGESDGILDIAQNITIEYDKYNNLINQFVTTYDLKNVTCQLSLNLDLTVDSPTQQFVKQNFTAMSLEVPLAMNTISIDTSYDLSNHNNLIEIQQQTQDTFPYFKLAIALLAFDALLAILFIIYLKKSETEEDKYNNQLKKILNNYDSYISRVEDDFNMQEYQILKVQRFSDLLEIRDTMQLPIIMLENKEQLVTCFVIPTPSNILYFYSIGATQPTLPAGKTDHSAEMRENDEQKV